MRSRVIDDDLQTVFELLEKIDDLRIVEVVGGNPNLRGRVVDVRDGEEAVQYINGDGIYADRAKYPLPQIMLLDLKLPRVDGFEVLRWLRHQPELDHIVVLVLTMSSDIRDMNRAYKLGANSFMVKPTDFQDVTGMINVLKNYWLLGKNGPRTGAAGFDSAARAGGTDDDGPDAQSAVSDITAVANSRRRTVTARTKTPPPASTRTAGPTEGTYDRRQRVRLRPVVPRLVTSVAGWRRTSRPRRSSGRARRRRESHPRPEPSRASGAR